MKPLWKFSVWAIAFWMAIFLFQLPACTWDKAPYNNLNGSGVCYQTEIAPLINSNCAKSGCHDGSDEEAPLLTSYNDIMNYVKPGKPSKSKLIEVITGSGEDFMPPAPNTPLTQDQVNLIQQWILEGAGNDPNCAYTVPCDTTNVTYSGTIFPVIQNNCLGCHSNAGTGGGILLTNYSQIVDNIDRIWGAINHDSGFTPMPQGAAKLSTCDITMIEIWMNNGMPDN